MCRKSLPESGFTHLELGKVQAGSSVVALLQIILIVGVLSCDSSEERTSRPDREHLYDTLQEEEWPVYRGPCIVFQAPSDLRVYRKEIIHTTRIRIDEVDGGTRSTLLTISQASREENSEKIKEEGIPKPDSNAFKIGIGGMDTYFYEERKDGRHRGGFSIDFPSISYYIKGWFYDLSPSERDLAFRIIASIRLDAAEYTVPGGGEEPEKGILLEPLGNIEREIPMVGHTSNNLCW